MAKVEQSYWNGNGKYQDVQDVLWAELVPSSGESMYTHGEIIRGLGRLWYEWGNNGNCNACDDGEVTEMYEGFLSLIENTVPNIKAECDEVRDIIVGRARFNTKEIAAYNALSNKAIEYLIEERNIDLDEFRLKALQVQANDKMGTAAYYRKEAANTKMLLEVLEKTNAPAEDIEKMKSRIEHNEKVVAEYEGKADEIRQQYIEEAVKQNSKKVAK